MSAIEPIITTDNYYRNSILGSAVRPARLIRRVFGFGKPSTSNRILIYLYHVYTAAIFSYLFVSIGFVIYYLTEIPIVINIETVLAFSILSWYFQVLVAMISGLRVEYLHVNQIANAWVQARADYWFCHSCNRKLKYVTWACIGVASFIVLSTFILDLLVSFGIFGPIQSIQFLYFVGQANYIHPFLDIFLFVPWAVNQASYGTLIFAIKYAFEGYGNQIRKSTDPQQELATWSITYSKLINLLHEIDKTIRFYAGFTILTVLPSIVGIVFVLISDRNADTVVKVVAFFWGAGTLFVLFVVCTGAVCNKELERVFRAFNERLGDFTCKLDSTQQPEAAILLQRMTYCKEFGITAWDLFVIKKDTIITLMSIIITYVIILLQFAITN